jgi:hypothetical protein
MEWRSVEQGNGFFSLEDLLQSGRPARAGDSG